MQGFRTIPAVMLSAMAQQFWVCASLDRLGLDPSDIKHEYIHSLECMLMLQATLAIKSALWVLLKSGAADGKKFRTCASRASCWNFRNMLERGAAGHPKRNRSKNMVRESMHHR